MMAFEVRATLLHEPMRQTGKQLFIDTITGINGPDVGQKMAADLQTTLELAMNSRGQASSAMHLSRLQGYVETMLSTLSSLQAAGVGFHATEEPDGARGLRVELFPATGNVQKPAAVADLDDLEGPDFEAALAKLPEAERQKYLESA